MRYAAIVKSMDSVHVTRSINIGVTSVWKYINSMWSLQMSKYTRGVTQCMDRCVVIQRLSQKCVQETKKPAEEGKEPGFSRLCMHLIAMEIHEKGMLNMIKQNVCQEDCGCKFFRWF